LRCGPPSLGASLARVPCHALEIAECTSVGGDVKGACGVPAGEPCGLPLTAPPADGFGAHKGMAGVRRDVPSAC
jgi:hypothetical protein